MSKKILAIYFSQTGQLSDIIENFCSGFQDKGHRVEIVRIEPEQPYPFPWTGPSFFAQMPDCVNAVPTKLKPISFTETRYDLIIIGYQAWFLSASIPCNSFLNNPEFKSLLKDCPVITLTGARNMWISAMEQIRPILKLSGAKFVGHIPLADKHHNLVSFITIFHWMFKGKKDRYLGIFPKPGVADEDIEACKDYGKIAEKHLESGNWTSLQETYIRQKAIEVKYHLMFIESKAKKIFTVWANLISKRKNKTAWLVAFKYYLIIALFIAAPIILTVDALFFKPFRSKRIKRQLAYFSGVNYK